MEKREQRLREVFKERIDAFREACFALFGYRIDMVSEATAAGAGVGAAPSYVTLRPQHADGDLNFRRALGWGPKGMACRQ